MSVAVRSPRILSLCSGIGGLEAGIRLADPGARTVCYVEREAFAAACLVARMENSAMDRAPVWDDLKTFDGRPWRGKVSVVTGGYPCQPFSLAGKQRGTADPRHLWPHIAGIVREVRPVACFFENVPNHINRGFAEVCEDLWTMGYRVEAGIYSASEIGAPQLRKRLFILACRADHLADADGDGQQGQRHEQRPEDRNESNADGCSREAVADTSDQGLQGRGGLEQEAEGGQAPAVERHDASGRGESDVADSLGLLVRFESWRRERPCWPGSPFPPGPCEHDRWERMPGSLEPSVRGDAPGLASRVDRLRALGNCVVPQVACLAWLLLWEKMKQ